MGKLNHKNIVRLEGFYEDSEKYYIVTELVEGKYNLSILWIFLWIYFIIIIIIIIIIYQISNLWYLGGELFDQIVKKKFYNEKEARAVFQTLVETVGYCHKQNIAHRDLKPENILVDSVTGDIKIGIFQFLRFLIHSWFRICQIHF